MKLSEALFNWLQIRLVANARPEDGAAQETVAFFEEMLKNEHAVEELAIAETDATMVHVRYRQNGNGKRQLFQRERAGELLSSIEDDARFGA